jgi:hypothetical protein
MRFIASSFLQIQIFTLVLGRGSPLHRLVVE